MLPLSCPPARGVLMMLCMSCLTLHVLLLCSLERKKSPNRLVVDDAVNQVRRLPSSLGLQGQHGSYCAMACVAPQPCSCCLG